MAAIKTNVMRILDKEKISYEITTYDVSDGKIDGEAVAEKIGKQAGQVFKTLVTTSHSGANYVFVVPVIEELDLKKASHLTGEKHIEMLHVKDLQKTTGYVRGGCSPIGMKKQFKTFIHQSAKTFEQITFSGGKIGVQVSISPAGLQHLIHAEFGDLIK